MNRKVLLLLAAAALVPAFSSAVARPAGPKVEPTTVLKPQPAGQPTITGTSPGAPAPTSTPVRTGPCQANLKVERIEIARRGDGSAYDVVVTVINTGTEAVEGQQTAAGGILGVSIKVSESRRTQTFAASMGDINHLEPGRRLSFGISIPANSMRIRTGGLSANIERGPDGPRCAYDSNRHDDYLTVSLQRMHESFDAGNAVYTLISDRTP